MFKMSDAICWEIRNRIKTQQSNKRCNLEGQYTTWKDSIPATNHFDIVGQNFNTQSKFILIERLNQTNLDKLTLRKRFKIREHSCILKLETQHPKGLNRELNKI